MRKREGLGGKTVSKRLAVLGCAVHCGHVDRRAPTSPIIVFGLGCKVLPTPAPPPGSHSPCLGFLPSVFPPPPNDSIPSTNCPDRFGGLFLYGKQTQKTSASFTGLFPLPGVLGVQLTS